MSWPEIEMSSSLIADLAVRRTGYLGSIISIMVNWLAGYLASKLSSTVESGC
jgi:hypothetical protein